MKVTCHAAKTKHCVAVRIIYVIEQVKLQQVWWKVNAQEGIADQQITLGPGQAWSLDHDLDGCEALLPAVQRRQRHGDRGTLLCEAVNIETFLRTRH